MRTLTKISSFFNRGERAYTEIEVTPSPYDPSHMDKRRKFFPSAFGFGKNKSTTRPRRVDETRAKFPTEPRSSQSSQQQLSPSLIASLPPELLTQIFSDLPTSTIFSCLFVSSLFHSVAFSLLLSRYEIQVHLTNTMAPTSLNTGLNLRLVSPLNYACLKTLRISPLVTEVEGLHCAFDQITIDFLPSLTQLVDKLSSIRNLCIVLQPVTRRSRPNGPSSFNSSSAHNFLTFLNALRNKNLTTFTIAGLNPDPFSFPIKRSQFESNLITPLDTLTRLTISHPSAFQYPIKAWMIETINKSPIKYLSVTLPCLTPLTEISTANLENLTHSSPTIHHRDLIQLLKTHPTITSLRISKCDSFSIDGSLHLEGEGFGGFPSGCLGRLRTLQAHPIFVKFLLSTSYSDTEPPLPALRFLTFHIHSMVEDPSQKDTSPATNVAYMSTALTKLGNRIDEEICVSLIVPGDGSLEPYMPHDGEDRTEGETEDGRSWRDCIQVIQLDVLNTVQSIPASILANLPKSLTWFKSLRLFAWCYYRLSKEEEESLHFEEGVGRKTGVIGRESWLGLAEPLDRLPHSRLVPSRPSSTLKERLRYRHKPGDIGRSIEARSDGLDEASQTVAVFEWLLDWSKSVRRA
ncbi:hypothetical protein JAAARDRAFT_192312 [Jaapia argillacea MUCL 33604]|uniref:F-box domain-containing protein n=1 Tax=Jaapia argillacea MUCL 33604 TaxID=933084 RepID=A0A067QBA3_9AGAM|nr:hypothetical protein JAAARDRAFT_192312 [Jaapia argillacea MUCL 33604]